MAWNRGLGAMGILSVLAAGFPAEIYGQDDVPAQSERALTRELLQELIGINTAPANGCTKAAEAMAARLRSAGFPDGDVLMAGPRPEKQNLGERLRRRGQGRPIHRIPH